MTKITLGAVAYDPKVVTIWEGFRAWFATHNVDFDFVLYSNYERQVEGHFAGEFDVAWNSPLAWIETERIAKARGQEAIGFCMRDTDQDLTSVIVVPQDSPITSIDQLTSVAVGAPDSPQATLIPLQHLAAAGVKPTISVHDKLFGKHGDHIGGERDAAKAMMAGEVQAAAMIDGNHLLFTREGTLGQTRILAQTERYDHCIFTALGGFDQGALDKLTTMLLGQSYSDPVVRPLLDLEGLKAWKPGRKTGFAQLSAAIDDLDFDGAQTVRTFIDRLSA